MTDWIADRRLAGFAIRVLERIGSQQENRSAVLSTLIHADREELPHYVISDLDATLATLGYRKPATRAASSRAWSVRPPGLPGRAGRSYWVMRTSPWERPYLWAEATEGRLRQGWAVADEQNLEVVAEAVKQGHQLTPLQLETRRALRMLTTWPGGMRFGDLVVAPNLPEYGRLSVFQVIGSYEWSLGPKLTWGERFGHVLPVELVLANLDRRDPTISDGLRSVLRAQTRLYNISGYGGDVELLVSGEIPADRRGDNWLESDYETLFGLFPPEGSSPSPGQIDDLSVELGRTPDAVSWQWADGARYVHGKSASTTSAVLMTWLDTRSGR